MRGRAKKIVSLLLLALLISCKVEMPKDVLPPKKMETVLYDYHLVQSMAEMYTTLDYKEKLMYMHVYDKHNITKEIFDSSLVWYNRYPRYMKDIYANLEARMDAELELMSSAKAMQNETVDLNVANLAPDNAELWTGHTIRMLTATPLNNKVIFGFDAPKDSSFVTGDSIAFSFNAILLSSDTATVNQEAYAALTLEYADNSFAMNGVNVAASGRYTIAAPRNFGSRIKSVSGYLFYCDNDSTRSSRIILESLSLKRVHPVESTKK